MKRLLIPLSVLLALFAAIILFQPTRARVELPPAVSSQQLEGVRTQNGLAEYTLQVAANPPWYDPAWLIRRPITINNAGSALTNYQVLVALDTTFDFNHAQTDGADLRVTAGDGTTTLSFWIESWNSAAQKAWVWVKVPSLPAGNTVIYLYYDNPAATSVSNGQATFDVYDGFETYPVGTTPTGDYSNPGEWTRYPGNPVLNLGSTGAWDASGATFASVISDTTAGQYRMYYHGIGAAPCAGSCIGLATSSDGKTWTKYAGNPIMTPGSSGAWDSDGVRVPMVWKEGPNDYRMMYTGSGSAGLQEGYATSTDGISWSKYSGNPVFNDPNGWGAHNHTEGWGVIKVGSQYLMWYSDLSAPRESSIAYSTDLINWTPYASTPIFASSGVPSDYTYSQFCPFTFVYGGYYYVLVPSYTSVGDYSRYYLYRSSSPYFPTSDRHLVRVSHTVGAGGQWDAVDSDTPYVLTTNIQRDTFPDNQLWNYYAGASTPGNTWREGLMIEPNIAAALTDAALPSGTLAWAATGDVTVVASPVRQGLRSLQLNDTSNASATYIKGSFASLEKGSMGVWMRRNNTTLGDYDLYLYENSTIAAVAGLGRNRKFHYWNKIGGYGTGFHDTAVSWAVDTWYLVTMDFDAATETYDFVVYDQNLTEVVRQSGISFGNAVTGINAATLYSDSVFVGHGYADDYRLRKWASPAPTVQIGAAQPTVDLAITKTANAGTIYVGDSLIYTVRVTNPSLLTAPAVFVTDTLPASVSLVSATPTQGSCNPTHTVTCLLGNVPGGGSATIQIIVTAITSGIATNTVQVSSNAVDPNWLNNTDSIATTILPQADLSVQQVDHPDPVWVGDPVTYTVTIHNGGPSPAVNVQLNDTLPSGVIFNSATPSQGTCSPVSPLVCNLGNIAVGNNAQVVIRVTTTVDGLLTNLATASSDTHDSTPANNTSSETTTVLPVADLSVQQVDHPDPVWAGASVTYTVTIHNGGPSLAVNVRLNDTLPSGVIFNSATPSQGTCTPVSPLVCNLGNIAVGNNAQVVIRVTTTVDGLLTNLATASSDTHDSAPANNTSSETTTVLPVADLSVQQVDHPDPVWAGAPVTYTVTIHNGGPSLAVNVRLNDTLPSGVIFNSATPSQGTCTPGSPLVCNLGNIAVGNNAQVVIRVTTTVDGLLTNLATASSDTHDSTPANNTDSETTTVLPMADLSVQQVDHPDPVWAGAPVTYTVTIHNGGPSPAVNVRLNDTLPSGVIFNSATPSQGTCTPGSPLVCDLGNIAVGNNAQVVIRVTTTVDGLLTNLATASSDTHDSTPANNTSSETTTVLPSADLGVSQVDRPDPVRAGDQITYTITAHNSGPSASAVVTLNDTLPGSVVLVSATPSAYCTQTSPVVCTLPGLPVSGSHQVQVVVQTTVNGWLTNTVTVASSTHDPNLANNTSVESTIVATQADLSVSQTDLPDPVYAGDPLTYTITVHNGGPNIAANIQLTDTLPSGVTLYSVTSSQGSCSPDPVVTCELANLNMGESAIVTIVVNTSLDGIITNRVEVASDTDDQHPLNNHSVANTTVTPVADLSVSQVDQPDPVRAGFPLTYTLTVYNAGPSSSASVTLVDNLPLNVVLVSAAPSAYCTQASPVVCTLPGLPAGGNGQVRVVVNTAVDGLLTNTATVASPTYDRNLANNTSFETTVVATAADLSVTQEDNPDPVLAEQELTYILTVHNAGPSIAASVQLTDTLPGNVTLVSATPDQGSCRQESVVICTLGNLASKAGLQVVVVVIPQAEGSITNTVQVATQTYESNLGNNTDIETTRVLPLSADLKLTLTGAPDPVAAGAFLTYTAHVSNLGPSRAISPSLAIDLASEVTFINSTPPCSEQSGIVTCPLDEIPSSSSADVTVVVQVAPSTFASQITSSASVTSAVADPVSGNNHASAPTNVIRRADLDISIRGSFDPVGVTNVILTYTLVYTNYGPSDAIFLSLTDTLPANVDYVGEDSSPACDLVPTTRFVTCDLGDLAALHSDQVVVAVRVSGDETPPLINQVEIASQTIDPYIDNNKAKITTGIDFMPPLAGWIAPVETDANYYFRMKPGLAITLEVAATDNLAIDRVRFRLWDHAKEEWVELGVDYVGSSGVYEYVWVLPQVLLPGPDEIDAFVYDIAGNLTRVSIFIFPSYPMFLPITMK